MYYPCGIRCQIIYQPNGMKPSPSQQYARSRNDDGYRDLKLDVYLIIKVDAPLFTLVHICWNKIERNLV